MPSYWRVFEAIGVGDVLAKISQQIGSSHHKKDREDIKEKKNFLCIQEVKSKENRWPLLVPFLKIVLFNSQFPNKIFKPQ